jgi:gluconate 2-dehydrogenase gamma chain
MAASRRDFLTVLGAGGVGLLLAEWPGVNEALAHAHAVRSGTASARFAVLTPAEVADVTAIAARIMPTTDTPGATEAGVVHFIDRAFAEFAAEDLPDFRKEIEALAKRATARRATAKRFSDLGPADQDAVLTEIETTDIFRGLRGLVMLGMFADPKYGGNRGEAGWKLIGFENRMVHSPPFGYYDAQAARGTR